MVHFQIRKITAEIGKKRKCGGRTDIQTYGRTDRREIWNNYLDWKDDVPKGGKLHFSAKRSNIQSGYWPLLFIFQRIYVHCKHIFMNKKILHDRGVKEGIYFTEISRFLYYYLILHPQIEIWASFIIFDVLLMWLDYLQCSAMYGNS